MLGAILAVCPSLAGGRLPFLGATVAMVPLMVPRHAVVGIKNASDCEYHGDNQRRKRHVFKNRSVWFHECSPVYPAKLLHCETYAPGRFLSVRSRTNPARLDHSCLVLIKRFLFPI
jgi:hypothetical protein